MDIDWISILQWPAMMITVWAAWWVGSRRSRYRKVGFYLFFLSNMLWVIWGWYTAAWALVVLQFALAAINFRGAKQNERQAENPRLDRADQPAVT